MKKKIQLILCLIVFYLISTFLLFNISYNVGEPMNAKQCFMYAFIICSILCFFFWIVVLVLPVYFKKNK